MLDTKLKIRFRESPGYRHLTATGVFGGPIASGDLLCNFFLEHRILPEEIEIIIDPPSKPTERSIYPEGQQVLIRELQVGIIMNPRIAKSVGEWLITRADEMMKMGSSTAS